MKNNKGIAVVEIIIAVVVIGIVAFAGYYVFNRNSNDQQSSINSYESIESKDELPTDISNIKPITEIQAQAQADNGGKDIIGIELENEDGKTIYVVHFSDGSIVAYDAFSGVVVVLNDDNDDEIEADKIIPTSFVFGITIQDAVNIAKNERPNSVVEKIELELEGGVVVYSVRFTDDSRVDVNAKDGTIQRLKDEEGTDIIKVDDDFDDDGIKNPYDDDDDDDGINDRDDDDDDNDGVKDEYDDDDDNDGMDDDKDDDDDEDEDDEDEDDDDSSGSRS